MDSVICIVNTYPLDSIIQPLNNRSLVDNIICVLHNPVQEISLSFTAARQLVLASKHPFFRWKSYQMIFLITVMKTITKSKNKSKGSGSGSFCDIIQGDLTSPIISTITSFIILHIFYSKLQKILCVNIEVTLTSMLLLVTEWDCMKFLCILDIQL